MDNRGQFTFYRSFWEAIKGLPKKDRLPILEAIISYALDGTAPSSLSPTQNAVFLLTKPILDSSRKKAASGKQGGSKPKAKGKQTPREDEKEKENEIENEGEEEKKQPSPDLDALFVSFWSAYPNQIAQSAAKEAWDALGLSEGLAHKIIDSLDAWRLSETWTEKGGKFIPRAAKFLADGYWKSPPPKATGENPKRELDSDEVAAIQRMMQEDGYE